MATRFDSIILKVDAKIANRLLALNREFYARFASSFSRSRSAERIALDPIMPYLADGVKVLDVGCGNGRLAAALDRKGYRLAYVGIDVTAELIAIAEVRKPERRHVQAAFRVADISAPGWTEHVQADAPFDLALALAVLHHIPSFALRGQILREVRTLLRPDGIFIMSNWQFTRNARLRRKIVPWQTVGIDERELEEGDALLDWKRDGTGYRHCHLFEESEVEALAAQSGFEVVEQFDADAELNLFSVLKRA